MLPVLRVRGAGREQLGLLRRRLRRLLHLLHALQLGDGGERDLLHLHRSPRLRLQHHDQTDERQHLPGQILIKHAFLLRNLDLNVKL